MLVLQAGGLQRLVFGLLLPFVGIVAHQRHLYASHYRHDGIERIGRIPVQEPAPNKLTGHIGFTTNPRELLAQFELGAGRQNVVIPLIHVIARRIV